MPFKKSQLALFLSAIFLLSLTLCFYSLSRQDSSQNGLTLQELEQFNQLALRVGDLLERRDPQKNQEIQTILNEEIQGAFQLLYRDWSVKLYKSGEEKTPLSNLFFNWLKPNEYSLSIPVGKSEVKGIIIVRRKVGDNMFSLTHFSVSLFFAAACTLSILSLIFWHKGRRMIRPIDRLCQQFTKYRREQESIDLQLPPDHSKKRPLERRVILLEELWEKFQSMQFQLAAKVEELELSKRELEQSNQEKETFNHQLEKTIRDLELAKEQERRLVELGYALAEFGHDIGNANGSILAFVSLLLQILEKDHLRMEDLARCLPAVRRIKISSNTISGLTSDLLEFSRGKTELHLEQNKLHDFVGKLEVNFGFAVEFPIEFHLPENADITLRIDDRKITRVIVNLVKNAWEKLQDDEAGQIDLFFSVDDYGGLSIGVCDNGEPVPAELLPRLFKSFQTHGKERGTGLGLAICKKVVEAHGGWIKVENITPHKGVRFMIYLPQCAQAQQKQLKSEAKVPTLSVP